jgi:hypothetical protein
MWTWLPQIGRGASDYKVTDVRTSLHVLSASHNFDGHKIPSDWHKTVTQDVFSYAFTLQVKAYLETPLWLRGGLSSHVNS